MVLPVGSLLPLLLPLKKLLLPLLPHPLVPPPPSLPALLAWVRVARKKSALVRVRSF